MTQAQILNVMKSLMGRLLVFAGHVIVAMQFTSASCEAAIVAVIGLNQTIPGFGGTNPPPYEIDFDGDGIAELGFRTSGSAIDVQVRGLTQIQAIPARPPNLGSDPYPIGLNSFIGSAALASAIWFHDPIGHSNFRTCFDNGCLGLWPGNGIPNIEPFYAFLGTRFQNANGDWHYAWVHLGINGSQATGKVAAYGWETIPNTPLAAGAIPEASHLSLLLLSMFAALKHRSRSLT